MTHIQPGRAKRGAFTLVELLVVILIIALLVSLTAAGVMKIFYEGPKVKVASEIRQFDVAIQQAEQELNGVTYLPSYLVLREDSQYYVGGNLAQVQPRYQNTVNFLRRAFGKNINLNPANPGPVTNQNGPGIDWNGDGVIDNADHVLEGQHCLVFWLGGIPSAPGGVNGVLGFSTNPYNPAAAGGTRRGPFFTQFEPARLIRDPNGFFKYADAWPPKVGQPPQPYAYFSAYGVQNGYVNSWGLYDQKLFPNAAIGTGDCPSLLWPNSKSPPQALQAYNTGSAFSNPNTHQVISAGKDNLFGTGGKWNPAGGGSPTQDDKDNQTNFARGLLDAGQ
jgi:prepilin-type N-terminal cleavage/methylation domain-containing protein